MYDVNVLGALRVTQALLPALRGAAAAATSSSTGSIAGHLVYEGGGGYTAAKHGAAALVETLRLELVRPAGAGHRDRAGHGAHRGVLAGPASAATRPRPTRSTPACAEPLIADDIADCIAFAVTRPHHVNIDLLVVRPRAQAAQHKVHRER